MGKSSVSNGFSLTLTNVSVFLLLVSSPCSAFQFHGRPVPYHFASSSIGNHANHRTSIQKASSNVWGSSSKRSRSRSSCSINSRRTDLSMHMGHSHSHHHHHDHKEEPASSPAQTRPKPTTVRGKILHYLYKRRVTRILFAALVTLLPPLLLKSRTINNTNIAVFLLTSTALSLTEQIRKEVKYMLRRIQGIREGFIKHSPPKMNAGKYLFNNDNAADRVTLVGVVVNLVLSVGKAVVGVTCHSSALVADAGHSLSDLFSDFITLWAVQIARLPPDDDHPYGHGKFEAVGSLFLALTLFGTGISVGASSNAKLLQILQAQAVASAAGTAGAAASVTLPTFPALIMAALSITSKEWLYRITKQVGEETNSQVVIANAWHHRSDAYSSILALGSIGLAMAVPGMVAADAAAGLLVAGMICMTGAEIMGEAVKQLTDTSDEDLGDRVKVMLAEEETEDVVDIKRIRTRWMGSSAIIDLSITTPGQTSSSANRAIEERVKYKIMNREPDIIDAEVHASSDSVVCPLLTATSVQASEDVSVQGVEDDAREILMAHKDVASVEKCIVHYSDTVNVNVDVSIKLENSESATVHSAAETGKELKDILQESNLIHTARIYLDLNESQEEFALPSSRFSKPASVRP